MKSGNNSEAVQVYTEVNCLLKYFPDEYVEKIPKKLLSIIKEKSDEKYNIVVDIKKRLKDQNITQKTKNMLVVLKYNYWSNESEKEYYKKCFYENESKYQESLSKKYSTENLFENKISNDECKSSENIAIIEYKESWFIKILNKIKRVFKNRDI